MKLFSAASNTIALIQFQNTWKQEHGKQVELFSLSFLTISALFPTTESVLKDVSCETLHGVFNEFLFSIFLIMQSLYQITTFFKTRITNVTNTIFG